VAEETEVLGGNLPQCRFVYHKSHMIWVRTLSAAVGNPRLTAYATALPLQLSMYGEQRFEI
jgi:hypothetical protein